MMMKQKEKGLVDLEVQVNKEMYKKQIEAIGKHLINNAEEILRDYDLEHIREINIVSNIRVGEIPTVEINKSYIPRDVF